MQRQIYVNLPVKDIERSRAFFSSLGFEFNAQFSGEQSLCVVVEENICVMLLREDHFKAFTKKPLADARRTTEVLLCLSCRSREQVDELVRKALAAGGQAPMPVQDLGFMYGHGFEDPDGHQWELVFMQGMPPQA